MSFVRAAMPDDLAAGFADPALAAQEVFRTVLVAMASPGKVVALRKGVRLEAAPMPPAAGAIALTLADLDTPVWLSPAMARAAAWLRFHSGAPVTAEPGSARFAFAVAHDCPPLDAFDLGTDAYPDRSTTAVIEVAALGSGDAVTLSGPGLPAPRSLLVAGLADGFWAVRAALAPLFPRGIDIVLTSGASLTALPRTTRAQAQGG